VALPVAEHRILPAGPFVRVAACSSCIAAARTAAVAACAVAMPGDQGPILDLPCLPLYVAAAADDVVAEVAGVDVAAAHVAAVVPSVAGEPSVAAAAAAVPSTAVARSSAVAPFAAVAVAVAVAAAAGPAAVCVLAALLRCRPWILASCLNLGE